MFWGCSLKYNYRQISSNIVKLAATKADAMIIELCSFVGHIRKWRMFVEVLTCVGTLNTVVVVMFQTFILLILHIVFVMLQNIGDDGEMSAILYK